MTPSTIVRVKNNWLNWTIYTVLRLAVFLVPLAIMLVLRVPEYLAVIFAALIGIALSILLLSKWRGAASASIYNRRSRKGKLGQDQATILGEEEDAAVDAALQKTGHSPTDAAAARSETANTPDQASEGERQRDAD